MKAGNLLLWGLLVAAALAAPRFLYPVMLMQVLCFAIFAMGFNLLFGAMGLLSFGHAAFFGSAAYVCGHAAKEWGLPPEAGIALGVAVAALLGLLIGGLAIRRQGIYLAMITFGLAEVVYFAALRLPFTGGEDGLQSVPRGVLFGIFDLADAKTMYYTVLAAFVLSFAFVQRLLSSPLGQVIRSIRENEPRAISLGYEVQRYKLLVFVISAAYAGLAGALKTLVMQFASLTDIHWHKSGEVVLMTLLGGVGTLWGPSIGAGVVVALNDFLAESGEWATFILGGVFVACVLLFRHGVVGQLWPWIRARWGRHAGGAGTPATQLREGGHP